MYAGRKRSKVFLQRNVRSVSRAKKKSKAAKYQSQVYIPKPLVTSNGMIVDLPYFDEILLQTSVTTEVLIQYRGASIQDPYFTGIGHQPLGRDQWAGLYQRYRVISCSIEVELCNSANAADLDPVLMVLAGTETSVALSANEYAEQPYSRVAMIGPQGNSPKKLKLEIKTADLEGDFGAKYDKDYSAAMANNPVRDFYWNIIGRNVAGNNNLQVFGYVKLIYKTLLYDRVDLNLS